MKIIKLITSFFIITSFAYSQEIDTSTMNLRDIQLRQANFNKIAMISLNTWAVGNIAYGTIANFQTSGEAKYFHQMNAGWNIVNLAIGVPGIIGAYKVQKEMNFEDTYKLQRRMETIYLVNAGLDVAYMTGGLAMRLHGKTQTGEMASRWKGYGSSLIFQGGYLFAHDLAMFILLKTNSKLLNKEWDKVSLQFTGTGMRIGL